MWLREDSRRDSADNKSTIYLSSAGGGRGSVEMLSPQVFRDRFIRTYDPIYELVARCPRPGLAMVAVDHHGVAAAGYLAAKPRSINVGIVGRHTVADLFLDSDPSLSLRHLAVILHPAGPVDEPRLRLLDLRTSEAFKDERGRQLEGLSVVCPAAEIIQAIQRIEYGVQGLDILHVIAVSGCLAGLVGRFFLLQTGRVEHNQARQFTGG